VGRSDGVRKGGKKGWKVGSDSEIYIGNTRQVNRKGFTRRRGKKLMNFDEQYKMGGAKREWNSAHGGPD